MTKSKEAKLVKEPVTAAELIDLAHEDPRGLSPAANGYEGWVVVKLLGGGQVAGYAHEVRQFGVNMMRLIVPEREGQGAFVVYYNNRSVYSVTPVSEETARFAAEAINLPMIDLDKFS